MKIEKHEKGNVLILDADDTTRVSLPPTCSLQKDSAAGNTIHVLNGGKATTIDSSKVSHLIKAGTPVAFTGDVDDLMDELVEDFFFDLTQSSP